MERLWDEKNNQGDYSEKHNKSRITSISIKKDDFYSLVNRNKEANVNKVELYIRFGASRHFTKRKDWCLDFVADKTGSNYMIFNIREEYEIAGKGNM